MSERDAIRDMFFEECEDLLDELHEGLQVMESDGADDDCINAIFRAVHSIKGGAGAFGLDALVGFSHVFETVLDQIRDGAIIPDPDLVQTLQSAGDILSDLVDSARAGTAGDTSAADTVAEQLESVLGDQPADDETFDFETISADFDFDMDLEGPTIIGTDHLPDLDTVSTDQEWLIKFQPFTELYATGHEPLILFRALAELGEITIEADVSRVAGPESFDWTESYLSWEILLVSNAPQQKIMDVFEFVDGLCALSVVPQDADDAAGATQVSSDVALPAPEIVEPPEQDPGEPAGLPDTPIAEALPPRKEPPATLRVEVDRIDSLVNTVGELIINQAMLSQRVRELGQRPPPELMTDLEDYKQLARNVQEGIMDLRMQPIRQLFQRMNRIARETANTAEKPVTLELEGEDTKVDKKVIEKLAEPLTHMVRNAIDHGIEPPDKRAESGKPAKGTVRLNASHKSGHVLIQIVDDGGGLNREKIRETAEGKGLVSKDDDLTEAEIDNLLFCPGFSTASTVTSLSGRGVGMDVVKTAITALGGRVSIASEPGVGSTFTIVLPLTMAVLDGMVVCVGDEMMVVPIAAVEEAIRPKKRDVSKVGSGSIVFENRGDYLPVVDLGEYLGHPPSKQKLTKRTFLIVRSEETRVALAVDQVIDKRQVVIKSLSKNYRPVPGVSAATILGDGKVALIVDPDPIAIDTRPRKTAKRTSSTLKEKPHAA
ncbi:MAG: chemotaxis protein CheA [Paracoccaceae bacterium]